MKTLYYIILVMLCSSCGTGMNYFNKRTAVPNNHVKAVVVNKVEEVVFRKELTPETITIEEAIEDEELAVTKKNQFKEKSIRSAKKSQPTVFMFKSNKTTATHFKNSKKRILAQLDFSKQSEYDVPEILLWIFFPFIIIYFFMWLFGCI